MLVEVIGILVFILGLTLSIAVFRSGIQVASMSYLTYLVFVISINFLNLLLIQFNVISPLLNFFGLYALLYGILLRKYRLVLQKKNAQSFTVSKLEITLIVLVFLYLVLQSFLGYKLTRLGFDDFETLPGILLMSISSIKGLIKFSPIRRSRTLVFMLFSCSSLLSLLVIAEFFIDYNQPDNLLINIIPTIFIITYLLLNALIIHGLRFTKSNEFTTPVKYSTSSLDNNEISKIASEVESHLKIKRPFLKANYTLDELSKELRISKPHISQSLNEHFDKTFLELINTLRIEEAIKMIDTDSNNRLSIKEIMFDSGFQSKSTFIKHFKKITGSTPSEFRELKKNSGFE